MSIQLVQPHLTMIIDKTTNDNYTASFRRPGMTRPRDVNLPADITSDSVQTRVVTLREQLTQWSKDYNKFLDPAKNDGLHCDPEKIRPMWDYLAGWGRDLYWEIFHPNKPSSSIAKEAALIKKLEPGAQIQIDAPRLVIPWGLLYHDELPEAEDKHYWDKHLNNFWGFQYQIELQPPYTDADYDENNLLNIGPYLDNSSATRLTFSINKKSDIDYKTGQMTFFSKLGQRFTFPGDPPDLGINECRDTVIKSMIERKEPHHLFYFYCHHTKGEGVTSVYGSKDYKEQTRIMMDGEKGGVIQLKELKKLTQDQKLLNFKYPPLIFLNACDSGQLEMGDPSGFMEYFVKDLHSVDYIGTEANVPATFADYFGQRFIEEFLAGKPVGAILRELSRSFAEQYCSPFGLYYSLFGLAELRLSKKVEEATS